MRPTPPSPTGAQRPHAADPVDERTAQGAEHRHRDEKTVRKIAPVASDSW
jgi:hypothetical protein